mmetsp:Transcript_109094/g.284421  ORF Transcript_109094/g.284421 Transcript_109094/m.284421 type:complete len:216 (-) Transcript_109094:208-855(-)
MACMSTSFSSSNASSTRSPRESCACRSAGGSSFASSGRAHPVSPAMAGASRASGRQAGSALRSRSPRAAASSCPERLALSALSSGSASDAAASANAAAARRCPSTESSSRPASAAAGLVVEVEVSAAPVHLNTMLLITITPVGACAIVIRSPSLKGICISFASVLPPASPRCRPLRETTTLLLSSSSEFPKSSASIPRLRSSSDSAPAPCSSKPQ